MSENPAGDANKKKPQRKWSFRSRVLASLDQGIERFVAFTQKQRLELRSAIQETEVKTALIQKFHSLVETEEFIYLLSAAANIGSAEVLQAVAQNSKIVTNVQVGQWEKATITVLENYRFDDPTEDENMLDILLNNTSYWKMESPYSKDIFHMALKALATRVSDQSPEDDLEPHLMNVTEAALRNHFECPSHVLNQMTFEELMTSVTNRFLTHCQQSRIRMVRSQLAGKQQELLENITWLLTSLMENLMPKTLISVLAVLATYTDKPVEIHFNIDIENEKQLVLKTKLAQYFQLVSYAQVLFDEDDESHEEDEPLGDLKKYFISVANRGDDADQVSSVSSITIEEDVKRRFSWMDRCFLDVHQTTPLIRAVQRKRCAHAIGAVRLGNDATKRTSNGDTIIHHACSSTDEYTLRMLLEELNMLSPSLLQTIINAHNVDRKSPLYWATENRWLDSIMALLQFKADPFYERYPGDSCIETAIKSESLDIINVYVAHVFPLLSLVQIRPILVKLLLATNVRTISKVLQTLIVQREMEAATQLSRQILYQLSKQKRPEMLAALQAFMIGINEKSVLLPSLLKCIKRKDFETFQVLMSPGVGIDTTTMKDDLGNTVLHIVAKQDLPQFVEFVLLLGANPMDQNDNGETPLHLAIKGNQLRSAHLLLEHEHRALNVTATYGTPWVCAVFSDSVTVLEEMVRDYFIPFDDQEMNPIMVAIYFRRLQHLRIILNGSGLRLNKPCTSGFFAGKTALQFACERGNAECVQMLLTWETQNLQRHADAAVLWDAAITGRSLECLQLITAAYRCENRKKYCLLKRMVQEFPESAGLLFDGLIEKFRSATITQPLCVYRFGILQYGNERSGEVPDSVTVRPIRSHQTTQDQDSVSSLLSNPGSSTGGTRRRPSVTQSSKNGIADYLVSHGFWPETERNHTKDMHLFELMLKHRREHLFRHKWVQAYIVRWMTRTLPLALVLLLCHLIFVIIFTIFTIKYRATSKSSAPSQVLGYAVLIAAVCCVIKEIFFHCFQIRSGFKRRLPITEILLFISAADVTQWVVYGIALIFAAKATGSSQANDWSYGLAVIGVVVAWLHLVFVVQRIPFVGVYTGMYKFILCTLFRINIMVIPILLAFTLGFYGLLGNHYVFAGYGGAILKATTMFLGEIDLYSLYFEHNESTEPTKGVQFPTATAFLLFGFIWMVSIALMNMMTGLAVYDVQEIREAAFLEYRRMAVTAILQSGSIWAPSEEDFEIPARPATLRDFLFALVWNMNEWFTECYAREGEDTSTEDPPQWEEENHLIEVLSQYFGPELVVKDRTSITESRERTERETQERLIMIDQRLQMTQRQLNSVLEAMGSILPKESEK